MARVTEGDNLNDGVPTYAEMTGGKYVPTASRPAKGLGNLPYKHKLRITLPRTGKSIVAYKRDIGTGAPGAVLDLHTEVARALGFNGKEYRLIEDA